jgi:hypothetical protein
LQPRERVDRHGVGLDPGDVAVNDCSRSGEKETDAIREARKIGTGDRAANGEGDLLRLRCRHRRVDGPAAANSAVLDERGRHL